MTAFSWLYIYISNEFDEKKNTNYQQSSACLNRSNYWYDEQNEVSIIQFFC